MSESSYYTLASILGYVVLLLCFSMRHCSLMWRMQFSLFVIASQLVDEAIQVPELLYAFGIRHCESIYWRSNPDVGVTLCVWYSSLRVNLLTKQSRRRSNFIRWVYDFTIRIHIFLDCFVATLLAMMSEKICLSVLILCSSMRLCSLLTIDEFLVRHCESTCWRSNPGAGVTLCVGYMTSQ